MELQEFLTKARAFAQKAFQAGVPMTAINNFILTQARLNNVQGFGTGVDTKRDTQVITQGDKSYLIDSQTGQTIKEFGSSDDVFSELESEANTYGGNQTSTTQSPDFSSLEADASAYTPASESASIIDQIEAIDTKRKQANPYKSDLNLSSLNLNGLNNKAFDPNKLFLAGGK